MKRTEHKRVVTLPDEGAKPMISPMLSQSAQDVALAYTAGAAARRAGSLPKINSPVAGGPGPSIPHLTGHAPQDGGRTLAEYAQAERGVMPAAAGSIISPPNFPPPNALQDVDIRPGDTLPETAQRDPAFVHGQGSMYAASQPALALKYGVVRGNRIVPPSELRLRTKPQLKPETLQGLESLASAQKRPPAPLPQEQEVYYDPSSSASAAATVGNGRGDRDPLPPDKDKLASAINQLDEFQLSEWRNAMMKDILNSDDQKKIIESRLEPLDITDLVVTGYIRQRIPIVPGRYEITLQTYDGSHDLALKRMIMQESKSLDVSEQYLLDKYSFYGLAVGVHSINDKVYPDCTTPDGNFSDEAFTAKFNQIMRLNIHLLASIGVNILWFEQRVRKLCKAETLGNG